MPRTKRGGMDGENPDNMTIGKIRSKLIEMGYEDDVLNPRKNKMLKADWVKLLREKMAYGAKPESPGRGDTLVANATEAFRQLGITTQRPSSPGTRVASPPPRAASPPPRVASPPRAEVRTMVRAAAKSAARLTVEKAAALPLPPRK